MGSIIVRLMMRGKGTHFVKIAVELFQSVSQVLANFCQKNGRLRLQRSRFREPAAARAAAAAAAAAGCSA